MSLRSSKNSTITNILIGLVGDNPHKGKIVAILEQEGFFPYSISEDLLPLATGVLFQQSEDSMPKVDLSRFRAWGNTISRGYWVSIAMSRIAKDHSKIVITDLIDDDIVSTIKVLRLSGEGSIISEDETEETLKEKLHKYLTLQ